VWGYSVGLATWLAASSGACIVTVTAIGNGRFKLDRVVVGEGFGGRDPYRSDIRHLCAFGCALIL